MMECMVIGDSIGVGFHMFKPHCASYSVGGITSHGWAAKYKTVDLSAKTVIISLGTNDYERADTYGKLKDIRKKVKAEQVYWIAPHPTSKPVAFAHVTRVAEEHGDKVISTARYQADKIHPSWAGYQDLVKQTWNKK